MGSRDVEELFHAVNYTKNNGEWGTGNGERGMGDGERPHAAVGVTRHHMPAPQQTIISTPKIAMFLGLWRGLGVPATVSAASREMETA